MLTLLSDLLQRPVNTQNEALDQGNAMGIIPWALVGSKAFKKAKNEFENRKIRRENDQTLEAKRTKIYIDTKGRFVMPS